MRARQFITRQVSEGEVVKFPKKHKGDLESTHDCPKCGGDLQGGKYMGHQVKVCMPCKQVYLPPNSGIDQQGNKIVDEIAGAFPSPSTREKWAKDAAASNAAEAKRLADKKAAADAERLRVNNAIVDKEQRINYHPMPDNEVPAKEDAGQRNTNRTWAQITDYEKRAKATSNDIKKQHYLKMADELRAKLPVNEVAMRMQGSSQSEKDATAREKARQAEELRKHQAIVKAYVDIMSKGQPLPPKMQQSYNTMPDFRKEVDAALANIPGRPGEVDLEQRRNYHLLPKNESNSNAMANTAKRLTDPNDGKTTKLRAAGDKRREEHLKSRDITKKNESIDRKKQVAEQIAAIEAELEEHGKASRALCISSRPDSDLGASNLASCKSQGLRARDGKKSHKLGKGPESRVKVGGHKIKGHKYGGPLPDWS